MRLLKVFALLATVTATAATAAQADPGGWGPETPNFNLQVVLRPTASGPENAFGLVKFRQPNDAFTIVYLDVWLRDLAPNHSYYLERATGAIADDDCSEATNWTRLGRGPVPQAITTDERGTGGAELFRAVPPAPGTKLDIHFRVVDATTMAVVLASDCYQFTISQ
jgi:hypothetical protein